MGKKDAYTPWRVYGDRQKTVFGMKLRAAGVHGLNGTPMKGLANSEINDAGDLRMDGQAPEFPSDGNYYRRPQPR